MERHWHAAIPCLLAAIGASGLMGHPRSLPITVLLFALVAVAPACLPPFWAILTLRLRDSAAAAAVGFINAFGSIAGFAAPFLLGYLSSRTGSFTAGMAATAAAGIAAFLLLLLAVPKTSLAAIPTPHPPAADSPDRLR